MNIDDLTVQLLSQINITRIVEVKPYSSILVVCRVEETMAQENMIFLNTLLEEKLSYLLEGQKIKVLVTKDDIELDFYRIDPNG